MKVLSIGNSAIEITSETDYNISDGVNVSLDSFIECGGGYAGNVAYLLSKWGIETYIASMLGSDESGNKIKKEFEAIGTKIDLLETSFEKSTSKTIIVVNKNTKAETILNLPNNVNLKKYAFLVEPDIIFSDGSDYNATITAFDKYPKVMKVVGINKVTKEALELAKFANYIIFNKSASEMIANKQIDFNDSSTLVSVYNLLKQRYIKSEIIVTLGERGSLYSINSNIKIMPPVSVSIVDNFGAGNIYTGAFIYAMGRNFGFEKSICYASIAASLSVGKLSCRNSIPNLVEVSSYYDSKFGAINNPNNTQNNAQSNTQSTQQVNSSPQAIQNTNSVPTQNVANPGSNNDNTQNA